LEPRLARHHDHRSAHRSGTFTIADKTCTVSASARCSMTGPGIWGGACRPDECVASCRRVELGVDFIDTADSYGP